jgi:hypothetical protein
MLSGHSEFLHLLTGKQVSMDACQWKEKENWCPNSRQLPPFKAEAGLEAEGGSWT